MKFAVVMWNKICTVIRFSVVMWKNRRKLVLVIHESCSIIIKHVFKMYYYKQENNLRLFNYFADIVFVQTNSRCEKKFTFFFLFGTVLEYERKTF